jgi:hypothetical protein
MDNGSIEALDIPEKYIKEMLCDWWWVGRSFAKFEDHFKYYKDNWFEVREWYGKNKSMMLLSDNTKSYVENFLAQANTTDIVNPLDYWL